MELKNFIKNVLVEIIEGVDEASEDSLRGFNLSSVQGSRTIEFDIAVTAESESNLATGAGIKVLGLLKADANGKEKTKKSEISRIQFGVNVDTQTKEEKE